MTEQRYRSAPAAAESQSAEYDVERLADQVAREYWKHVRCFAARHLSDSSAAEDVAQETMRVLLEALQHQRVRDLRAIRAFLFQTARNLCLHAVRAQQRTACALAKLPLNHLTPESDDAFHILQEAEDADQARRALSALPTEDRELLRLFFDEECDATTVGRCFGIPPGAARVRKHRALARFAEHLQANQSAVLRSAHTADRQLHRAGTIASR